MKGAFVYTDVLICVLLLCVHDAMSVSPPNCTVRSITCAGHNIGTFEKGDSIPQILQNLHNRFCGCTYITGSILISLGNRDFERELTEDDFNFLYHVEQISDALLFSFFPQTSRVILPSLRIIRGERLIGDVYALGIENSSISDLILPKLTQITRGNVYFGNTGSLCNHRTINWNDIIDSPIRSRGGIGLETMNACEPDNSELISGLPNCALFCEDSVHCWTPEYCQKLTKTVCPNCLLDRCYDVDDVGTKQCCNHLCAAGCQGPTADQCHACKAFENNGTCVTQCPPPVIYDQNLFQLVPNPDHRLAAGDFCVDECPSDLFELSGGCVLQCPPGYFVGEDGRTCQLCNGPCPRECAGISNNEIIKDSNIEEFRGCTIITSGGLFFGTVSGFNYSRLELFSTIEEIRGPLRIQEFPETTFPYLRNLKIIGSANATEEISARCGIYNAYSFILYNNPNLEQIDLSSLEEIRGSGVLWAANPRLCFTGDLGFYLSPDTNLTGLALECRPPNSRRDPNACIDDGFICHEQCNSTTSCFGRNDHQCDTCRNFLYRNRCIENCSLITAALPSNSSGLFQNEAMKLCEDCDPECVNGCNGTGSLHCFQCRNYFVESRNELGMRIKLCVPECPLGTFLNVSLSQCISCHENCTAGCVGPLPYLDMTNGCLDCSLVLLDRDGRQEHCLRDHCHLGTYSTQLSSEEHLTGITGDLQFGYDICKPCNELCTECTGEGTSRTVCPLCKIATSSKTQQCVSACDEEQEYLDLGSMFCQPCSTACQGCTGPAATECLECASDFVKKFIDGQKFSCITSCDLGEYFDAETKVCTNCDPLCDQCVGPGSTNCTSCTNIRFQVELEQIGPRNETLHKCFGCLSTEQLVNQTCVNEIETSSLALDAIAGGVGAFLLLVVVCLIVMGTLCFRFYRNKTAQLKLLQSENQNLTNCVQELITIPIGGEANQAYGRVPEVVTMRSETNRAYGVANELFFHTSHEPVYCTIDDVIPNEGVLESSTQQGDYSYVDVDKRARNVLNSRGIQADAKDYEASDEYI